MLSISTKLVYFPEVIKLLTYSNVVQMLVVSSESVEINQNPCSTQSSTHVPVLLAEHQATEIELL